MSNKQIKPVTREEVFQSRKDMQPSIDRINTKTTEDMRTWKSFAKAFSTSTKSGK